MMTNAHVQIDRLELWTTDLKTSVVKKKKGWERACARSHILDSRACAMCDSKHVASALAQLRTSGGLVRRSRIMDLEGKLEEVEEEYRAGKVIKLCSKCIVNLCCCWGH